MKKQVLVSDKSGTEIPDGQGAVVTIKFNATPNGSDSSTYELHLTDAEAKALGGRPIKRRGRPAGQTSTGTKTSKGK